MDLTTQFYSPGKVLLVGEYYNLHGLPCIAFPVAKGQRLEVKKVSELGNTVHWKSTNIKNKIWLETTFNIPDMLEKNTTNATVTDRLCNLLSFANGLNPNFLSNGTYEVSVALEFNQSFGLGSSSTLVALIAQWAKVDPLLLQFKIFGGSGYDAAVCSVKKPIVYTKLQSPIWETTCLKSNITEDWHLCFPNKKVNSRSSLKAVAKKLVNTINNTLIRKELDNCILAILQANTTNEVEINLEKYQTLLAKNLLLKTTYEDLNIAPIQNGLCKYLGAWGGDIILVNSLILKTYESTFNTMHKITWNSFIINE